MGCGSSRSVTVSEKPKNKTNDEKANKILHEENFKIKHDKTKEDGFAIESQMLIGENKHSLANTYKFLEKLGEGSFAKVFKVMHLLTKELRAIKIIKKDYLKYQDDEKETLKEIEILSMLDHPNIIKVYEYFTDQKFYYLVVELGQGGELYEQLYHIQFFNERDASIIMRQILSTVCYLHSKGIVHRDLKPENLLLEANDNSDLTIKLIDFGTANFYEKNKLTLKIGSSYYMAPEVINGRYDEKCDLWSCGVIMFILLSGNPPFEGQDDNEVLREIVKGKFSFSTPVWEEISNEAKDLIKSLLKYNPEERISAAEALKHPWINKHSDKEKTNLPKLSIANFLENVSSKQKLQQMTVAYLVHQTSMTENIKNLRNIFKQMDSSGDGRLCLDEIKSGYKKFFTHSFSDQECDEIIKNLDQDKSGYIEFEEFLRATIKVESLVTEQNLKMAFRFFDKDKSGKLSSEEIKIALGYKNSIDNTNIKAIIEEVDTNKDGLISFEEFKKMMQKALN
jgi:calcium-dependent protein kinase